MITQIGITAGNILDYLDKKNMVGLSELTLKLEDSQYLILMGLGWLVREGYVLLERDEGVYMISLRKGSEK